MLISSILSRLNPHCLSLKQTKWYVNQHGTSRLIYILIWILSSHFNQVVSRCSETQRLVAEIVTMLILFRLSYPRAKSRAHINFYTHWCRALNVKGACPFRTKVPYVTLHLLGPRSHAIPSTLHDQCHMRYPPPFRTKVPYVTLHLLGPRSHALPSTLHDQGHMRLPSTL